MLQRQNNLLYNIFYFLSFRNITIVHITILFMLKIVDVKINVKTSVAKSTKGTTKGTQTNTR